MATRYIEIEKPAATGPPALPRFAGFAGQLGGAPVGTPNSGANFSTWNPFTASDYATRIGATTEQAQQIIDQAIADGFVRVYDTGT